MGRNKDKYGGTAAFTFQEARDLLGPDTRFTTYGGHLFSDRPGWQRPYGEPALVVQMDAAAYDTTAQQELFSLAYGLNAQHRFNLETPHGPQAFELNTPIL